MTRIGTLGQHQQYVSRLLEIQNRVQKEQVQVTTQKKTTAYSGLTTGEVNLSLLYETEKTSLKSYVANNTVADERLREASTAIDSIRDSLQSFRDALRTYADGNPKNEANVKQIQDFAFRTMLDVQSSLNTNVNGQFLFSGGRINTAPVKLAANTLSDFQNRYNGIDTVYPTSRALTMQDIHLTATDTGNVRFDPASGTLYAANAGSYSSVSPGSFVSVAGTTSNNGNYTIRSHAATNRLGVALGESQTATNRLGSALGQTANAGGGTFITADGTNLVNGATGNLAFAPNALGQTVMTPTTVGSLSSLTVGTKFTVAGSTGGAFDGAYRVTAYNSVTGAVTLANDTDQAKTETVPLSSLTISADSAVVDGVPDTAISFGTRNGQANFAISGDTVTVTLPPGTPALTTLFANGDPISMGGTANHNGTFTVNSVTADTVTFKINPATSAGSSTFITAGGTNLLNATTGDLSFAFDAKGQTVMTPKTAGSLATLTVGTKFTVAGSTGGAFDGAYSVAAYDALTGAVTLANDTDLGKTETVALGGLTLSTDTAVVNGVPDTPISFGTRTGQASFTVSGDTVTVTLPPGAPALTTLYANGDPLGISGTANHNGTFTVNSVTADTLTFKINSDAVRVSQFVPQTERTDVSISFVDPTTNRTSTFDAGGLTAWDSATLQNKITKTSNYQSLSFSPNGTGGETISASVPGAFVDAKGAAYPAVGTAITLKSPTGVNDGVYEVVSNDTTNIVVRSRTLTAETATVATMDAEGWYKGDNLTLKQQVDKDRALDVGIYASDPAMEKALRALATIAQGAFGTAGGLENHPERIKEAQVLLQNAIQSQGKVSNESEGDLNNMQASIGFTQNLMKQVSDQQTARMSFLETRLTDIQGISPTEAIANLLADNNALQASYQTMAAVHKFSLLDFLK